MCAYGTWTLVLFANRYVDGCKGNRSVAHIHYKHSACDGFTRQEFFVKKFYRKCHDYSLMIIDMQRDFLTYCGSSLPSVSSMVPPIRRLIRSAKRRNNFVVTVEIPGEGPTIEKIRELTIGYGRHIRTIKMNQSVSYQPIRLLKKAGGNFENIVLCGVNTDMCVIDSAFTLAGFGCKVLIPRSATGMHLHATAKYSVRMRDRFLRHEFSHPNIEVIWD